MKTIPLTRNQNAIVDDDDYDLISRFTWHCHVSSEQRLYALTDLGTFGKQTMLYMHRLLLKTKKGQRIDHINGNGLDNRKCNLRIASHSQNLINTGPSKTNTSGFKGVSRMKSGKTYKWRAAVTHGGKQFYMGVFDTKEEAAKVYDTKAFELYGEFAFLNFPRIKQ